MIVKSDKPITINFVKNTQKQNPNGTIINCWSFSFPLNKVRDLNGGYKTFYVTAYYYDNTLKIVLKKQQRLADCVWNLTKYKDKKGIDRIGFQLVSWKVENEAPTLETDNGDDNEWTF